MKWLVRVFVGVAAFVALLMVIGLFLPASATVTRSISIERPSATTFTVLSNPRAYLTWAPWAQIDPSMQVRTDGPPRGLGARIYWSSTNPRVGAGALSVTSATPYSRIEANLASDGWGPARLTFDVAPEGGGSEVSMTFETSFGLNVIRRFVGLSFERRIGADYEAALAALRDYLERLPADDFSALSIEETQVDPIAVAYVEGRVRGDDEAQTAAFDAARVKLNEFLADERLTRAGPIVAITTEWNPPLWEFKVAAAYNGAPRPSTPGARTGFMLTHDGPVLRHVLEGDPAMAQRVLSALKANAAARLDQLAGPAYEVQVSDRSAGPSEDQITELYVPIKE